MNTDIPTNETRMSNEHAHEATFRMHSGFDTCRPSVAICFAGGTRSLDRCYPTFQEHILDRLRDFNVRIFAHTYADGDTWKYERVPYASLQVDQQPQFDEREYNDRLGPGQKTGVRGIFSQLLSVYRANALRRAFEQACQVRFDWILRVRPDSQILAPLPCLSGLDPARLYMPRLADHGGLFDHFAFGGPAPMETYCNRIERIDAYYQTGAKFHPESFLKWHLEQCGVAVERIPMDMTLLRTPGSEDRFHAVVVR